MLRVNTNLLSVAQVRSKRSMTPHCRTSLKNKRRRTILRILKVVKEEEKIEEKYMEFTENSESVNHQAKNGKKWHAISQLILNKDSQGLRKV